MITPNKSLVIVTSNLQAPGALELKKVAELVGMHAQILLVNDMDTAEKINKASYVIFRVGPKSYNSYIDLLSNLTNAHTRNNLESVLRSFDKVETARILNEASIPQPESDVVKKESFPIRYPVIIKVRHGNRGQGVGLLRSQTDYVQFVSEFPEEDYLLQEYIAGAVAQDKRIFIVDGKMVAAMKRTSAENDFRANLHTGGSAEIYYPTSQEVSLAIQATHAFNLNYAGVDIIDSSRGPLVLEVNPSPGFAISIISGIDVASEVIKGVIHD